MFSNFHNKTRVLIFSKNAVLAPFFLHILNFHGKDFNFISSENLSEIPQEDFVIFAASTPNFFENFKPNIALVSSDIPQEELDILGNQMTSGGVLIFPEVLNAENETQNTFFRKLEFAQTEIKNEGVNFSFKTSMGFLPFPNNDKFLAENLEGLKLLAQQFGIMEEEFYEAVMEFNPS